MCDGTTMHAFGIDCQAQWVHLRMRLTLLTLSQRGSDEV